MIILRKQGASSFLELTDTPTTYSGFENSFLKVNAPGNSIEFVPINANTQAGIVNIPAGTSSVSVDFSNQYPSIDYILAESGGVGTGYNTIIFTFVPSDRSVIRADYIVAA